MTNWIKQAGEAADELLRIFWSGLTDTFKPWSRPAAVIVCVVVLVLIGPASFSFVWEWMTTADVEGVSRSVRSEILRNRMFALGAFLAAPAAALGIYYNHIRSMAMDKQAKTAVQAQTNTAYTEAINQLGDNKMEIRLGAIYALERIALQDEDLHAPIMETLCAFVRENVPWRPPEQDKTSPAPEEEGEVKNNESAEPRLRTDIQAILSVIGNPHVRPSHGKRFHARTKKRIDLRRVDLRGAECVRHVYERVDFSFSMLSGNFNGAELSGVYYIGATLISVDYTGGTLRDVHYSHLKQNNYESMSNVRFIDETTHSDATLNHVSYIHARLNSVDYSNARMDEVNYSNANLNNVNFRDAKLSRVDFIDSELSKVFFDRATMNYIFYYGKVLNDVHYLSAKLSASFFMSTTLNNVHFNTATLNDVSITGVTLSDVRFSGAKLGDTMFIILERTNVSFSGAEFFAGVEGLTDEELAEGTKREDALEPPAPN